MYASIVDTSKFVCGLQNLWSAYFSQLYIVIPNLIFRQNFSKLVVLCKMAIIENLFVHFLCSLQDVLSVAFSVDNRQIVSGSRDKTIKLWNTLAECKYTIQVRCDFALLFLAEFIEGI